MSKVWKDPVVETLDVQLTEISSLDGTSDTDWCWNGGKYGGGKKKRRRFRGGLGSFKKGNGNP